MKNEKFYAFMILKEKIFQLHIIKKTLHNKNMNIITNVSITKDYRKMK